MKLVIQIPCYNEEEILPISLAALPRKIEGIDTIEYLIIDDGSVDNTVEVARKNGVNHIVRLKKNKGLAKAFIAGLEKSLSVGADIIVNTDADNQYQADDIEKLIAPILEKKADYVVGARPIADTKHFSPIKKMLQFFGSWVVRQASKTSIPDAPSGFRAMSKKCAMQLNVYNEYTYTLETIIQAGLKNITITSVPIRTNEDIRPSRLFKSIPAYIKKSVGTIIRIFVVYKPFRFFMSIALVMFGLGLFLGIRFLIFYFSGSGGGHIQSVILAGVLLTMGIQTGLIAFVADLQSVNRKLLEDIQYRIKKEEYKKK